MTCCEKCDNLEDPYYCLRTSCPCHKAEGDINPETGIPYVWYREDKVKAELTAQGEEIEKRIEAIEPKPPEYLGGTDDEWLDGFNTALRIVKEVLNPKE